MSRYSTPCPVPGIPHHGTKHRTSARAQLFDHPQLHVVNRNRGVAERLNRGWVTQCHRFARAGRCVGGWKQGKREPSVWLPGHTERVHEGRGGCVRVKH